MKRNIEINNYRGWVHTQVIEEQKGLSTEVLRHRRREGHVIEGVHWRRWCGKIYWNFEALDYAMGND